MSKYYIYVARQRGVVVYIGRGQGDRYKHIISGMTKNYKANKAHFLEPESVVVSIEAYFENESDVKEFEELAIREMRPDWNREFLECRVNDLSELEDYVKFLRSISPEERLQKETVDKVLSMKPLTVNQYLTSANLHTTNRKKHKEILLDYNLPFLELSKDKRSERAERLKWKYLLEDILKSVIDNQTSLKIETEKLGLPLATVYRWRGIYREHLESIGLLKPKSKARND
ncbi:TPA: hypothetical protein P0E35_002632 [Vibrio harveyi]|nr:hypothetical protein [Vibrio harveyi]